MSSLLTAKDLVGELDRLGIGLWGPDVVIKWTLEEPACPIAVRAERGKPHRYRMLDVLPWLLDRTRREVVKGVSPGAADKAKRIEQAMRMFATGAPMPTPATASPPLTAEPAVRAPAGDRDEPALPAVAPAKPDIDLSGVDFLDRNVIELLLEIIHGRDPRTAKAAEEAIKMRRARLIDEGRYIPVEDAQRMTDAMAIVVRLCVEAVPAQIAKRIQDQSTHAERLKVGEQLRDDLLVRLEKATIVEEGDAALEEGDDD